MNKEIRLIALDLDGTLLNSDKQLSPRNRSALFRASEKGILIVPTTGRLPGALSPAVRSLPFLRYVIAVNGAIVSDVVTGEVLSRQEISNRDALRILDALQKYDGIYDCYIDGCGYMNAKMLAKAEYYTEDSHQLKLVRDTRKPVEDLKSFLLDRGCPVQKAQIMFSCREDRDRALSELKALLPDFLHTCTYSTNIEINSPAANKGAALSFLCDHLNIPMECAMSFGDGSNDITMLKAAGIGVVMGNAEADILPYGDIIAPTCDEDGVADVLERLVL
ncbi:MAG: Cof-type HAD-IIB family hydrolase [Clostridiales bacterium]|nr:Cof-type HAD-IIB family hydrolase [Clostridiales bacterium]